MMKKTGSSGNLFLHEQQPILKNNLNPIVAISQNKFRKAPNFPLQSLNSFENETYNNNYNYFDHILLNKSPKQLYEGLMSLKKRVNYLNEEISLAKSAQRKKDVQLSLKNKEIEGYMSDIKMSKDLTPININKLKEINIITKLKKEYNNLKNTLNDLKNKKIFLERKLKKSNPNKLKQKNSFLEKRLKNLLLEYNLLHKNNSNMYKQIEEIKNMPNIFTENHKIIQNLNKRIEEQEREVNNLKEEINNVNDKRNFNENLLNIQKIKNINLNQKNQHLENEIKNRKKVTELKIKYDNKLQKLNDKKTEIEDKLRAQERTINEIKRGIRILEEKKKIDPIKLNAFDYASIEKLESNPQDAVDSKIILLQSLIDESINKKKKYHDSIQACIERFNELEYDYSELDKLIEKEIINDDNEEDKENQEINNKIKEKEKNNCDNKNIKENTTNINADKNEKNNNIEEKKDIKDNNNDNLSHQEINGISKEVNENNRDNENNNNIIDKNNLDKNKSQNNEEHISYKNEINEINNNNNENEENKENNINKESNNNEISNFSENKINNEIKEEKGDKNNIKEENNKDQKNDKEKNMIITPSDLNIKRTNSLNSDEFSEFTFILVKNLEAKKINEDLARQKIIIVPTKDQLEKNTFIDQMSFNIMKSIHCENKESLEKVKTWIESFLDICEGDQKKMTESFLNLFKEITNYNNEKELLYSKKIKKYLYKKKPEFAKKLEPFKNKYITFQFIKQLLEEQNIDLKDEYSQYLFYELKKFEDKQASIYDLKTENLFKIFENDQNDSKMEEESDIEISNEQYVNVIYNIGTQLNKYLETNKKTLREVLGDSLKNLSGDKAPEKDKIEVIMIEDFVEKIKEIGIILSSEIEIYCLFSRYKISDEYELISFNLLESDLQNFKQSKVQEDENKNHEEIKNEINNIDVIPVTVKENEKNNNLKVMEKVQEENEENISNSENK